MKVSFYPIVSKNQSGNRSKNKSNVQEKGGSNPSGPITHKNNSGDELITRETILSTEYRCLGEQFSELSKHKLEELRSSINKIINEKYPNKRKDYGVPPEERIFTPEQLKKFLNTVDNPMYKMLFLTMVCTGLRPGEAVKLKLDDLDRKDRCFWVWISKKKYPVRVPKYFPKFYYHRLKYYLEFNYSKIIKCDRFLFPNQYLSGYVSIRDAGKIFRETLDKVKLNQYYSIADDKLNPVIKNKRKLRYFTLNSLRKTFASYQGNLEQARMVLNHSSSKVTQKHYYATLKERKKELIEQSFKDFI